MQADFKPCPFCGHEEVVIDPRDNDTWCTARCLNCRSETGAYPSVAEATAAWNWRHEDSKITGQPVDLSEEAVECVAAAIYESSKSPRSTTPWDGRGIQKWRFRRLAKAAIKSMPPYLPRSNKQESNGAVVCHQLREAICHLLHTKKFHRDDAVIREMEAAISNYNGWEACGAASTKREIGHPPQEPTNEMIISALEASLEMRKHYNVDDVQPDTPGKLPAEMVRVCWRAMLDAWRRG